MAYSIQTAVSDGTLEQLDLSIRYMDKSHIQVYVDDVLADGSAYSYVWLTDTRIQIVPTVANGSTVKVRRKTLSDEMWHEFTQGARFSTTSMDENFEQLLFLAQEYSEGIYISDFYVDVDMHLKRILNLADPVNDTDAVNLRTLKDFLPYGEAAAGLATRLDAEEAHTAALAGAYGSSLVGAATYAQLRSYTGNATRIQIGGRENYFDGGHGVFVRTGTAADNDGTVLRDALGRSWERQFNGPANAKWWGLTTYTPDSTAALQNALNSGYSHIVIDKDINVGVTAVTMAVGQVLEINGVLNKLAGNSYTVLLNHDCQVTGTGTINGNGVASDCIVASGKNNLRVNGLSLIDVGGKGITFYAACTNYIITHNRLTNITGAAINVEYSSQGVICGNSVDTAHDGILFYGGDANTSTVIGSTGITIADNVIRNIVWGGIWGTLTSHVAVSNNFVENCADVGIDFEGCRSFSCAGNTAKECANGCFAVFFGSKVGTFSGNTAYNEVSAGAGFYATTNTSYQNERISIVGNSFRTNAGRCIYIEARGNLALSNSLIANNSLVCVGGVSGIYGAESSGLVISGNQITTVGAAIGIYADGVSASIIEGNFLSGINDTNNNPANGGGITLRYRSAAYPAQYNVVRDNRVDGFMYSILDSCSADVTKSANYIANNHVVNIYRSAGVGYTGVVELNRDVYIPANVVNATTF